MIFEGAVALTISEFKAAQKKLDQGMLDLFAIIYHWCKLLSLQQRMKDEAIRSENKRKEAELLAGTIEYLLCLSYCFNFYPWLD